MKIAYLYSSSIWPVWRSYFPFWLGILHQNVCTQKSPYILNGNYKNLFFYMNVVCFWVKNNVFINVATSLIIVRLQIEDNYRSLYPISKLLHIQNVSKSAWKDVFYVTSTHHDIVGYIKESRISEYISCISVDTRKYIITQGFKHKNKFVFRATIQQRVPFQLYI